MSNTNNLNQVDSKIKTNPNEFFIDDAYSNINNQTNNLNNLNQQNNANTHISNLQQGDNTNTNLKNIQNFEELNYEELKLEIDDILLLYLKVSHLVPVKIIF